LAAVFLEDIIRPINQRRGVQLTDSSATRITKILGIDVDEDSGGDYDNNRC